jgi:hypothetical protein
VIRFAALGLGLGAVALCGLIRLECAASPLLAPPPPMLAAAAVANPVAPPPGGDGRVREWVAIDLARPLFEPSRRPPATGTATSFPRLTGIVISTKLKDAIFMPSGAARAVVVTAGSRLDGVLIESIDADGVVVADAGGTRRIRPNFERQAHETAPQTPALSVAINDRPIFLMSDPARGPADDTGPGAVVGLSVPLASGASP